MASIHRSQLRLAQLTGSLDSTVAASTNLNAPSMQLVLDHLASGIHNITGQNFHNIADSTLKDSGGQARLSYVNGANTLIAGDDGTTALTVADALITAAQPIDAAGKIEILDATDATSATHDGASLHTDGGVSITKKLYAGQAVELASVGGAVTMGSTTGATVSAAGILNVNNATDASSKTDGSLQTDGGLSVAKKAFIGTGLTVEAGGAHLTAGRLTIDDATEATTATDGSLQTDGGLSVAKSAVVGIDLDMLKDGGIINFGANKEISLTHVHNDGLLLNGAKQLQFGDSGTYIHQSQDGQLDLIADTEIQITATTIDIDGAADISGNLVVGGNLTVSGDTVQVDVEKLTVEDPIIELARGNTGGDALDIGFFGRYNDGSDQLSAGLFRDTDDGKFHLFKDSQEDLSAATVVNTGATGYAKADLVVNSLDADGGITIDNITIDGTEIDLSSGDLTLDVAGDIIFNADGGDIKFMDDTQLAFSIDMATTAGDAIFKDAGAAEIFRIDGSANSLLMSGTQKIQFNDDKVAISQASDKLVLRSDELDFVMPGGAFGDAGSVLTDVGGNGALSFAVIDLGARNSNTAVSVLNSVAEEKQLSNTVGSSMNFDFNAGITDAVLVNSANVFVNGQMLLSGSASDVASGLADYEFVDDGVSVAATITVQANGADAGAGLSNLTNSNNALSIPAINSVTEHAILQLAGGGNATQASGGALNATSVVMNGSLAAVTPGTIFQYTDAGSVVRRVTSTGHSTNTVNFAAGLPAAIPGGSTLLAVGSEVELTFVNEAISNSGVLDAGKIKVAVGSGVTFSSNDATKNAVADQIVQAITLGTSKLDAVRTATAGQVSVTMALSHTNVDAGGLRVPPLANFANTPLAVTAAAGGAVSGRRSLKLSFALENDDVIQVVTR